MRGAIVFLGVFILLVVATLAYPDLPPGRQIYSAFNVPATDYPVLGIQATTLVVAVFNGVVYGIVAWLVYTIVERTRKRKPEAKPS
jgi:hypothetical protein